MTGCQEQLYRRRPPPRYPPFNLLPLARCIMVHLCSSQSPACCPTHPQFPRRLISISRLLNTKLLFLNNC
uniref:Uncharacterized protein n=1 Tax=Anguilla anguilla TaxID=7936 RepID=A0A0E9X5R4_ANGAN